MTKRLSRKPDVGKAAIYAVVVNAIQIGALALIVLSILLGHADDHRTLSLIAIVAALLAIWGATIDIREALQTRRRERTITGLQETNDQMDALNLKLRAQRHDFLNHIQVVYSLLEMGESQEAADYLERIWTEFKTVSRVMRTKVTAFNALLQVKSAACEERGIAFEMDIRSTLGSLAVPAWEICCIIGNLVDNAMDVLADQTDGRIELKVTEDVRGFTFVVSNNGAPVPEDMRETIFEPGVSTKGEGRGMGLSIVRQTLAEFGGSITLADGEETAFVVTVPHKSANGGDAC